MARSKRNLDTTIEQPKKKAKKSTKKKNPSKTADGENSSGSSSQTKKKTKFKHFRVHKSVVKILKAEGKKKMFEIQRECFDSVYDGKDILARAHTGSGKTLAFAVPVVSKLLAEGIRTQRGEGIRVLCLAPTRELAIQVESVFKTIAGDLTTFCIYGGSSYRPQLEALRSGLDILVGTCGRVKDLLGTGRIKLDRCKHVILDEADQMLDIGFAEDIEEILGYMSEFDNSSRQIVLFSATIPDWVQSISSQYMRPNPEIVDLTQDNVNKSSGTITHQCLLCDVEERGKVLGDMLLALVGSRDRVIVFADMKVECNRLAESKFIKQECWVLHGDIDQKQREITTTGFRNGLFPILIATDVAARGLDITGVQLVIHLSPPRPETYIHRSGRTGRAGERGTSIVIFLSSQRWMIAEIEKAVGVRLKRIGAPQAKDIAGGVSKDAIERIREVPEDIRLQYIQQVEWVVNNSEYSSAELLAASLAFVSGYTRVCENRSLLSSARGCLTLQKTFPEKTAQIMVNNWLKELLGRELKKIKGLQVSKDGLTAVFDVPFNLVEDLLKDPQVKKCTELPELVEQYSGKAGQRRGQAARSFQRGTFKKGSISNLKDLFGPI